MRSYLAILFGFLFSINSAALPSADGLSVVIETPFIYDDSIADNVKSEMSLNKDIPKHFYEYLLKLEPFESLSLERRPDKGFYDLYIQGKVLSVDGGNRASRYFTSGISGKALLIVELKMYASNGVFLYEGYAVQNSGSGFDLIRGWSNKKQINRALAVLPKKLYPIIFGGDLTTPEGVVRTVLSENPRAIKFAGKAAIRNKLYMDQSVSEVMDLFINKSLTSESYESGIMDSVSWCIKVLGETKNMDHLPLLSSVLNSGLPRKVKGYAKSASKKIIKANK
jgi:hypothetical protein